MIKKSDLTLVRNNAPILHTPPDLFNFDGDIDAEMFGNVLIDRMLELGGVGLSANQVGVNARVFAMGTKDFQTVLFNPQIVAVSSKNISLDEGCLSFPGVFVKVNRPESVMVKFQNIKGEWVEDEFHGLTARIFLHEYDHMEGNTFKDKVSKMKWDLAYNRMVKRVKKVIRTNIQRELLNIKNGIEEETDVHNT